MKKIFIPIAPKQDLQNTNAGVFKHVVVQGWEGP